MFLELFHTSKRLIQLNWESQCLSPLLQNPIQARNFSHVEQLHDSISRGLELGPLVSGNGYNGVQHLKSSLSFANDLSPDPGQVT